MMSEDSLQLYRTTAKRFARTRRFRHSAALDMVARGLGKPNWRGLVEAHKNGWKPSSASQEGLESWLSDVGRGVDTATVGCRHSVEGELAFIRWIPEECSPMEAAEAHGTLHGHEFYLVGNEFSVALGSQGWEITLDQAPSATPRTRYVGRGTKPGRDLDPAFVGAATNLLSLRARRMHEEVASDWARRSTMPDRRGRALHPLGHGLSSRWFCLHCDAEHDGAAMAGNLWHCAACGATPIDMFPEPFWLAEHRSA